MTVLADPGVSPVIVRPVTGKLHVVSFFDTATMQRGTVFPTIINHALNPPKAVEENSDTGTATVRGFRIFKHGTFRDSFGFERTWEPLHLDQMALHFGLLRDNGILPNVPFKTDHSFSVKDVVGYFTAVYRDPDDDLYLSSDFEFTEPDAYEKWKRGTYRSRSLEVGMYESNDGAVYFPVVMGCAFVDLPAVEGLYSRRTSGTGFHALPEPNKEPTGVTLEEWIKAGKSPQDWVAAVNYAHAQQQQANEQARQEFQRACDYAAALAQHTQNAQALGVTATYGLPGSQHTFTIGGRQLTDPVEVQRQITVLEGVTVETERANRTEYVKGLTKANKIGANQEAGLIQMVTDPNFTDQQFANFRTVYDAAPPQGLFQQHVGAGGGDGSGGAPPGGTGQQSAQEELKTQTEIVQRLRHSMPEEKVKLTNAYQRMTQLQTQLGQSA